MRQWLALDRTPGRLYYAVALGAVVSVPGCGPRTTQLAPGGLPAASHASAERWSEGYVPDVPLRFEVTWTFQTQQGRVRGRAAARFVPPDSLRFDYQGPFGRSGTAVMVGDAIVWAEPEEEVRGLIPVTPLFWAALGMPRPPARHAAVFGRSSGQQAVWRYAAGADTLTYVGTTTAPATLRAELRRAGDVVGTVEVEFVDSLGVPGSSRIAFPSTASTILFSLEAVDTLITVDPQIWRRP